MQPPVDEAGPTAERLHKAGQFFTITGRGKSNRRFNMNDDALGRALARCVVTGEECAALRRYALHWLAAGLQGPLKSVDWDRVYCFDPSTMSGLARTEAQLHHKQLFYGAQDAIGFNPAYVATQVACFGRSLQETGFTMGFKSRFRARERAGQYLSSAGAGLISYFDSLKPR